MPIMREGESYADWRTRVEEFAEQYALHAYVAYMHYTGGLTHDGRAMPPWADIGQPVQNAWRAAAMAAFDDAAEVYY